MHRKNLLNSFQNYVLRVPLFSLGQYLKITSERKISDETFKSIYKIPEFKEAILLASPQLYREIEKWLDRGINDEKKRREIKTFHSEIFHKKVPKKIINTLIQVNKEIDENIGNNPKKYISISKFLEELDTDFELKYLFQTDLIISCPKKYFL